MLKRIGISAGIFLIGVVIAFLWPRYFFLNVAGFGISGFTFATLALIGLAVPKLILDGRGRTVFFRGMRHAIIPVTLSLIWVGWQLLAASSSSYPSLALNLALKSILFGTAWTFIAAAYLSNNDAFRLLPIVTVACGFLAFVFGLVEYVSQQPLLNALGLYQIAAGSRADLDAIAAASTDGFSLRIKSVFVHPIIFGQVMALLSPFALHLFLNNLGIRRIIGIALFLTILASILLCQSRSPIIVLLAASGIYLAVFFLDVRSKSRLGVLVIFGLLAATSLPVVVNTVLDVVVGEDRRDQQSNKVRTTQAAKANNALQYKPFIGYGQGTAPQIAGVDGRNDVRTLDSFYITTAVETGYVGLAIFISLQISLIFFAARRAVSATSSTHRGIMAATVGMLVGSNLGLLIISSTDAYFFALLFFGYAIVYSGRMAEPRVGQSAFKPRRQAAPAPHAAAS